jgi:dienelactone hydrolase
MAEVVLFHHVQGLTPGIHAFADRLRDAGHTVHTPDLMEGRTSPTLEEGIAAAKAIGFGALAQRGIDAAAELPDDVVYAGFSSGVMCAQQLAQTRPDARGALLYDACLPVSEFGSAWPDDVPVQIHGMDHDPLFSEEGGDLDAARELVKSTEHAELFLYPGDQHLFADSSLTSHDPAATELLIERTLAFLAAR